MRRWIPAAISGVSGAQQPPNPATRQKWQPSSKSASQLAPLGLNVINDVLEALEAGQLQAGAVLEEHHHVCNRAPNVRICSGS